MPYAAKSPDANGFIAYNTEETAIWSELFKRQMTNLNGFACRAYLDGQSKLDFSADAIPQVPDVDARLLKLTGAGVEPVAALIPQEQFSTLLSNRRFPVATFIRRRENIDYIEEPDIFHEVFGHCPMLTNPEFCQFMERFGRLSLDLGPEYSERLFRLFWFTIEFGLIVEDGALKAFGAGIMSSPAEASHAASDDAEILPFDLETIFRTPYRIDIVQPVYFAIKSFAELAKSLDHDIKSLIDRAAGLGDLPPRYEIAA